MKADVRPVETAAYLRQCPERRLNAGECLQSLSAQRFSRVVYTNGALPVVVPARHVVDGKQVLVQPVNDPQDGDTIAGTVVTLEVDVLDEQYIHGWIVTVTGIATPCRDRRTLARLADRRLLTPVESVFWLADAVMRGCLLTLGSTFGRPLPAAVRTGPRGASD